LKQHYDDNLLQVMIHQGDLSPKIVFTPSAVDLSCMIYPFQSFEILNIIDWSIGIHLQNLCCGIFWRCLPRRSWFKIMDVCLSPKMFRQIWMQNLELGQKLNITFLITIWPQNKWKYSCSVCGTKFLGNNKGYYWFRRNSAKCNC
jgi:hypothetical protein